MKRYYLPMLVVLMAMFTTSALAMADGVKSADAPVIKLLSPVGGEHWRVGRTYRVSWMPFEGKSVMIYIFNGNVTDGSSGSTNYIYESPVSSRAGYFDWVIDENMLPSGSDLDGGKYQIRISDVKGNFIAESGSFSITRK